jgi:putrescine transport system permease protein
VRLGVKPEINAISTIMIVMVALGVIAAAWVAKRNEIARARIAQ